jgi:hypothetical protein
MSRITEGRAQQEEKQRYHEKDTSFIDASSSIASSQIGVMPVLAQIGETIAELRTRSCSFVY